MVHMPIISLLFSIFLFSLSLSLFFSLFHFCYFYLNLFPKISYCSSFSVSLYLYPLFPHPLFLFSLSVCLSLSVFLSSIQFFKIKKLKLFSTNISKLSSWLHLKNYLTNHNLHKNTSFNDRYS